jgi:hypothetical protein
MTQATSVDYSDVCRNEILGRRRNFLNVPTLRSCPALREMKCATQDEANETASDLHGRT